MVELAATIFSDGPSSNPNRPMKPLIRDWGTWLEGVVNSFTSNGGLIYDTRADLFGDISFTEKRMAWVISDPTVGFNGVYGFDPSTDLWDRKSDLPYSVIIASDAGAGTPNAIIATTSLPVSDSAVVIFSLFEDTTSAPVTVSFNGGGALTLKTNRGENASALTQGMDIWGRIRSSDNTFRLLNDQDVSALVAQAETAKTAAAISAAAAQASATSVANRFLGQVIKSDATADTNYSPSANGFGYSLNTNGSTGFPSPIGETISLMFGGPGRAFDIFKWKGVEAWYLRQVADDGSFGAFRQIYHEATASQIAGADSASRTIAARFGDMIDIREFGFNLSGGVGTEATNNAAFDRLIAHATANPGMVYRARKGDVVRFNAGNKIIPKSRLRTEGAELHWVGNSSGTGDPVLTLGQYVDFDAVRLKVPAGGLFRRAIRTNGDNKGDLIEIEAENQIANNSGSNFDVAYAMYGHRNKVRQYKCKKVDWAGIAWGDGGAGLPQLDSSLDEFDIEGFVVGFWVRNVTRFSSKFGRAKTKSVNAGPNPGHNAFLIEGAVDCTFGEYQLFDSGEHNFRAGGVHSGEQLMENCTIGRVLSGRAGQTGFKIWSGLNTDVIKRLTIGEMNIFDCGADGDALGFNDFGAMLQGLADSIIGCINVQKRDLTYSALDSVYLSQLTNVGIGHINARGAQRNAIRISEFNGNNTDSNSTTALNIGFANCEAHAAEGIIVECPNTNMRDININDFAIVGGTDAVRWTGSAARAVQPCYFRGGARAISGTKFNVPVTANIKAVDKFA